MKRTLGCLLLAALALVLGGTASSLGAHGTGGAACVASPVDGSVVHAGVITGGIDPYTDVVDGRFRLRVGPWRDRATGLTQKILWWAPSSRRAGGVLVVRGRTILGRKKTFVQRLFEAGTEDQSRRYYPSIIKPPSAGCWRLTLKTGRLRNALTARVDP
jgi:hypothetical protein